MSTANDDALRQATQDIWNQNAHFWDQMHGDSGNRYHRTMVEPTALKLLELHAGETVLEVACGNGAFARTMLHLGVQVVATDFSANLLALAKTRTEGHPGEITYALVDATKEEALLALGEGRFDAAVCNMGLMDMVTIDPLFAALRRLLKPGGRFVCSLQHPCFNSNGAHKIVEMEDRNGELVTVHAIKVTKYATPWMERGVGAIGQPTPHYLFHRPLHVLVQAGVQAGFVVDGFEEPTDTAGPNEQKWFAWGNYNELPPVLAIRFRLVNSLRHTAT